MFNPPSGERRQCQGRRKRRNSAVRFRSGPAFYWIRTRKSRTDDSVDVQEGGIKLARPDALTEVDFGRTIGACQQEGDTCRVVAYEGPGRPAGRSSRVRDAHRSSLLTTVLILLPQIASAQGSPCERAASNLERTFTGPLARSLALVAIVIGGLTFMFGEMGAKRQIAGIVFGGGLALFAAQFLVWLF